MTDIAETIERIRRQLKGVHPSVAVALPPMHHAAITRLLDAAEAGMRARDAALEEAARVAEAVDPEKPANWLHARHKIAFAIRSLKGAA